VLGESRELCNSPPEMNEVNEGLSKMDCLVGTGGWCELCLRVGSH